MPRISSASSSPSSSAPTSCIASSVRKTSNERTPMTLSDTAFLVVYVVIIVALAKPLGLFMAAVYEGRRTFLHPAIRPVERAIYRVAGIDETKEQGWRGYLFTLLGFNFAGFLLLYLILRGQAHLPMNPQ